MGERLQLASFVAGPEPQGRGYRILAANGLRSNASWQGSMPLTLLEWAKYRSPAGFCGRFAVTGGAIALRARFLGEGTAGPIAQANGVFIPQTAFARVFANERALFAAIAPVTQDMSFAERPVELELGAPTAEQPWDGLGLAWQDRQVFVHAPLDLQDVALMALESISPASQRSRVTGWSTTAALPARGDFMPLETCNLLVTLPTEPRGHDRFVPCQINPDQTFSGVMVNPPPAYDLWQKFASAGQNLLGGAGGGDPFAWTPQMTGMSQEALAWRFIGIFSKNRFSYAAMIEIIILIRRLAGEQTGAAVLARYIAAVAQGDRSALAELVDLSRNKMPDSRECQQAIRNFILRQGDKLLISRLDGHELLKIIRLLEEQDLNIGARGDWIMSLNLLDDRSVELSGPAVERERRKHLSRIGWRLGTFAQPGAAAVSRAQAVRLLRRRLTMPELGKPPVAGPDLAGP